MAHQYRCDQCGNVKEGEDFPFGWLYMESVGPKTFNLNARQLHLCSWRCVSQFARNKVKRSAN